MHLYARVSRRSSAPQPEVTPRNPDPSPPRPQDGDDETLFSDPFAIPEPSGR